MVWRETGKKTSLRCLIVGGRNHCKEGVDTNGCGVNSLKSKSKLLRSSPC